MPPVRSQRWWRRRYRGSWHRRIGGRGTGGADVGVIGVEHGHDFVEATWSGDFSRARFLGCSGVDDGERAGQDGGCCRLFDLKGGGVGATEVVGIAGIGGQALAVPTLVLSV